MLLLWTYFTSLEGATLILVSVPHSFVCVGGCDLTFWFRAVISGSVSRPDPSQASYRGCAYYLSTFRRWVWREGRRTFIRLALKMGLFLESCTCCSTVHWGFQFSQLLNYVTLIRFLTLTTPLPSILLLSCQIEERISSKLHPMLPLGPPCGLAGG